MCAEFTTNNVPAAPILACVNLNGILFFPVGYFLWSSSIQSPLGSLMKAYLHPPICMVSQLCQRLLSSILKYNLPSFQHQRLNDPDIPRSDMERRTGSPFVIVEFQKLVGVWAFRGDHFASRRLGFFTFLRHFHSHDLGVKPNRLGHVLDSYPTVDKPEIQVIPLSVSSYDHLIFACINDLAIMLPKRARSNVIFQM